MKWWHGVNDLDDAVLVTMFVGCSAYLLWSALVWIYNYYLKGE